MAKKSYQEVVRGIRSSKDPTMYISEVLTEIRQEIKGTDRNDKVISLQKLLYLNLLGYTFDWAVGLFCLRDHGLGVSRYRSDESASLQRETCRVGVSSLCFDI